MKLFKNKSWVFFTAERFSSIDKKNGNSVSTRLSILGICFGVMTLIVVMSVMNGFQREFIDAILEISSFHIRSYNAPENFEAMCESEEDVLCVNRFMETEMLISSNNDKQQAGLLRCVDENIFDKDEGFCREVNIRSGEFDFSMENTIVLGTTLARNLGVKTGDTVNVFATASTGSLLSASRKFVVTGIFSSGYQDINSTFAFIGLDDGKKLLGPDSEIIYGIKIKNPSDDVHVTRRLSKKVPDSRITSWREYNKSFFGALRIEKNMLFLLVVLIFIVVAVNIYNSMRRLVVERRMEISILNALGGNLDSIKEIFIARGFIIGMKGALSGMILGIFLCINIKKIFLLLSSVVFYSEYFFTMIFNNEKLQYVRENPMFYIYSNIPARMYISEVTAITVFGIFSAVISALLAGKEVLSTSISEVLHDE